MFLLGAMTGSIQKGERMEVGEIQRAVKVVVKAIVELDRGGKKYAASLSAKMAGILTNSTEILSNRRCCKRRAQLSHWREG